MKILQDTDDLDLLNRECRNVPVRVVKVFTYQAVYLKLPDKGLVNQAGTLLIRLEVPVEITPFKQFHPGQFDVIRVDIIDHRTDADPFHGIAFPVVPCPGNRIGEGYLFDLGVPQQVFLEDLPLLQYLPVQRDGDYMLLPESQVFCPEVLQLFIHHYGPYDKDHRNGELENDEYLLERAYIEKQEQRLQDIEKDLSRREQELDDRGLLLSEQEAKLSEEAKRLEEQEKVLSEARRQYDNYKDNVRKQAEYFVGMPPQDAVERLQKLEDLLIVDILREMDRNAEEAGSQSIVPYYLSLMDAERAASVQRKMTKIGEIEEL